MTAPDSIKQLVERFDLHRDAYRAGKYNETQLRREFLDPFFEALGWDVFNRLGYSEENKHVIHEDSLEIEGAKKAPDYAFKIGRERKFFVEAKKPFVKIETNAEVAFQLKRYVWSAKLPLGILTDFEEFAIYECRSKPKVSDSVKTGRVMLLNYSEYIEKWDEISAIFSHDAVMKGGFDKFANTAAKKKGTAEVDDAFLAEIEGWREALAKNVALRNKPQIGSEADLNYAVQMTIDRIIFLRICEDRGYESEYQLQNLIHPLRPSDTYHSLRSGTMSPKFERASNLGEEGRVYSELKRLFEKADRRYNSGLFHFRDEKGRGRADTFTTGLEIDDKALKDIIKDLYYPSPYVFSLIPADILGQIYEQFLGKVIRLTAGGSAKVEEKPEVRKAGGVYYTPTFIVSTIVINTLGKLLAARGNWVNGNWVIGNSGKMTPKEAALLKILDPACGSGTFLLGAYQYLLDWHLNWYINNDPEKWSKGKNPAIVSLPQLRSSIGGGQGGGWKLSVEKKKEILLNNIYGVDIDPQAVEVTKLSLLLKVIEDPGQLSLLDERILPDLGKNIQCGNSLIGSDYYENQQSTMDFTGNTEKDVNAFDWKVAFPEVFAQGGFDVVVGNPPYGANLSLYNFEYIRKKFEVIQNDIETYSLFMEQAIDLCKVGGKVSMIVPTGWYSGAKFSKLRRYFACMTDPEIIINLPYDIFNAWVDTTIFVTSKRSNKLDWPRQESNQTKIITFPKRYKIKSQQDYEDKESKVDILDWFNEGSDEFLTYANTDIIRIIRKIEKASKPLSDFADVQRGVTPFNLDETATFPASKPAFNGTVRRYSLDHENMRFVRFDATLAEFKPERYFVGPRLLLRELISRQFRLQSVKAEIDFVTNKSMQSILQLPDSPDLNYLLGMINSRLTSWYFLSKSNVGQRDDFPKIVLKETRLLPIRPINFNDSAEKAQHDKMVSLVERMLALQKSLKSAHNPQEADRLAREVESTDKAIDSLVYELYGLNEEEIGIVEGK